MDFGTKFEALIGGYEGHMEHFSGLLVHLKHVFSCKQWFYFAAEWWAIRKKGNVNRKTTGKNVILKGHLWIELIPLSFNGF